MTQANMTPIEAFEKALQNLEKARLEYQDKVRSIKKLEEELKETKQKFESMITALSQVMGECDLLNAAVSKLQKETEVAQSTANGAVNLANGAQGTANEGVSLANGAQETANGAVSLANAAQGTANGAVNLANAAQKTADAILVKNVKFFSVYASIDTIEKDKKVTLTFPERVDAVVLESLENDIYQMHQAGITRKSDTTFEVRFISIHDPTFTLNKGFQGHHWIPALRFLGIQVTR